MGDDGLSGAPVVVPLKPDGWPDTQAAAKASPDVWKAAWDYGFLLCRSPTPVLAPLPDGLPIPDGDS